MGSSRVLSVGPESTIALLAGTAVAQVSTDPSRVLALTAALTLLVAGWCFVARALRLGVMADLLSPTAADRLSRRYRRADGRRALGKLSGTHVSGNASIVEQGPLLHHQAQDAHLTTVYVGFAPRVHLPDPNWVAAQLAAR